MFNRVSELRRFLTALLLVAAISVQALIPAGFMPDFTGGKTTIVICTSTGLSTVTLDDSGEPDHDGSGKTSDHAAASSLCPYSTALTGTAPVAEFVAASTLLHEALSLSENEDSCSPAFTCKNWNATAPPALTHA